METDMLLYAVLFGVAIGAVLTVCMQSTLSTYRYRARQIMRPDAYASDYMRARDALNVVADLAGE